MSKILIVEDEAQLARFIELELIHEGNTVDKAGDGRSGLDMALSNDYDLILLDVMLPGINGFEVLRRVRAKKDTPHTAAYPCWLSISVSGGPFRCRFSARTVE